MLRRIGMIALSVLLYLVACWFRNLRDDTIGKILIEKESDEKWKKRLKYLIFSVFYFLFCFLAVFCLTWGILGFVSIPHFRKKWLSKWIAFWVALGFLLFSLFHEGRMRFRVRKQEKTEESKTYEELLEEKQLLTEELARENEKYAEFQKTGKSKHSKEGMAVLKSRREAIWALCEVEQDLRWCDEEKKKEASKNLQK